MTTANQKIQLDLHYEETLDSFRHMATLCGGSELRRLSTEENALLAIAENDGVSPSFRMKAIKRLEEINKKQIELLGHKVSTAYVKKKGEV